MTEQLPSEQVVVSAPMSFHGSAARIWRLHERGNANWQRVLLGVAAIVLITLAWCLVLCWYIVFGLLLVPYRLVRRGQRKRKMEELRHRELLATSTAALAATTRQPPPAQAQKPALEEGEAATLEQSK